MQLRLWPHCPGFSNPTGPKDTCSRNPSYRRQWLSSEVNRGYSGSSGKSPGHSSPGTPRDRGNFSRPRGLPRFLLCTRLLLPALSGGQSPPSSGTERPRTLSTLRAQQLIRLTVNRTLGWVVFGKTREAWGLRKSLSAPILGELISLTPGSKDGTRPVTSTVS